MATLQSLHHVTATVDLAQPDLDFYVGLLGLRLVKRTVNFDNHHVYHFYYGDDRGRPGTIMTTFPYAGMGVRVGRKGSGQVTSTAFSVPMSSLDAWRRRLEAAGVAIVAEEIRFGCPVIAFPDPSSLVIELVGTEDRRPPWPGSTMDPSMAVRGLYGVTLSIARPEASVDFLIDVLGAIPIGAEDARQRLGIGGREAGHVIDILETPDAPAAVNGLGTVHHVALAIDTPAAQLEIRERLLSSGRGVTEVRDRQYFQSIYFREPGGVLYEVATVAPGFTVDEDYGQLGQDLKLPPWEEPDRASIEAALPPISLQPT